MSKFALEKIEAVKGKISFVKLKIDGACPFDAFEEMIKKDGNLAKQLVTIYARMDQVANLQRLPQQKYKEITPSKEIVKEYEIKTDQLRVYLIKEEHHIVILGGKKNTQPKDIKYFRSIKKRYLDSKS